MKKLNDNNTKTITKKNKEKNEKLNIDNALAETSLSLEESRTQELEESITVFNSYFLGMHKLFLEIKEKIEASGKTFDLEEYLLYLNNWRFELEALDVKNMEAELHEAFGYDAKVNIIDKYNDYKSLLYFNIISDNHFSEEENSIILKNNNIVSLAMGYKRNILEEIPFFLLPGSDCSFLSKEVKKEELLKKISSFSDEEWKDLKTKYLSTYFSSVEFFKFVEEKISNNEFSASLFQFLLFECPESKNFSSLFKDIVTGDFSVKKMSFKDWSFLVDYFYSSLSKKAFNRENYLNQTFEENNDLEERKVIINKMTIGNLSLSNNRCCFYNNNSLSNYTINYPALVKKIFLLADKDLANYYAKKIISSGEYFIAKVLIESGTVAKISTAGKLLNKFLSIREESASENVSAKEFVEFKEKARHDFTEKELKDALIREYLYENTNAPREYASKTYLDDHVFVNPMTFLD